MAHIVNLIHWPIDLTLYPRIPPSTTTLIFKYWATDILVALQTFVEFAINYEGSLHYCSDHADQATMFFGV